jgi:hypothetical protein
MRDFMWPAADPWKHTTTTTTTDTITTITTTTTTTTDCIRDDSNWPLAVELKTYVKNSW